MSYDLRIWERPVGQPDPECFEQAGRTMQELERLKPGANPRFIALAEKMRARYPVLGQGSDAEEDDEGVAWIGDPLAAAKACDEAVWTFQLPDEDRVHVLRFVVDAANALGLTVLDDQIGMVFLPGGRVLPPERAPMWEGAKREMDEGQTERWTLATLRKTLKPQLVSIFKPLGFQPVKQVGIPSYRRRDFEYRRETEAGEQRVYMWSRSIWGVPNCCIGVQISNSVISAVLRTLFPERGEDYERRQMEFSVARLHTCKRHGGEFPVESAAELPHIRRMIEEPTIQILEMTQTAAGMDRLMSDTDLFPIESHHPSDPRSLAEACWNLGNAALVSAWLHGNEKYHEIEQYRRRNAEQDSGQRADFEKVLNYLREHVEWGSGRQAG